MERNARDVRKYYQRNKQSVYLRKALKRCRETGAIPTVEAVLKHHLPMLPIWASFADWAGQTTNWRKRRVQHAKLKELYTSLMSAKQPPNLYIPMGLGRKEYLVIEQHMKKQLWLKSSGSGLRFRRCVRTRSRGNGGSMSGPTPRFYPPMCSLSPSGI